MVCVEEWERSGQKEGNLWKAVSEYSLFHFIKHLFMECLQYDRKRHWETDKASALMGSDF